MFGPQTSIAPNAEAAARYILLLAQNTEQEPELITQLRLHKLLYYAQGWHLGIRGQPLFAERIEAWKHGPVVAPLYPKFADYGAFAIPAHEAADDGSISSLQKHSIEWAWERYSRYSAAHLRNMTHREQPWLEAYGDLSGAALGRREISHDSMMRHFAAEYDRYLKSKGIDRAELEESSRQASAGSTVPFDLSGLKGA